MWKGFPTVMLLTILMTKFIIVTFLAACLLKQEPVRYERVVTCCEHVTELRPHNVKGWYRLGLAHYHLRDYEKASIALKKANTLAGGQGTVQFCSLKYHGNTTNWGLLILVVSNGPSSLISV